MSYIKWEIEVTPYENENWNNADAYILANARNPLVRVNLGEAKDNFSFDSTNFNGQNNSKLNPNDRVLIKRALNTDVIVDNDLLMTGTILDSPDTLSHNKDSTKIEGYNYSEQVARAIVNVHAESLTLPEALELSLSNAGRSSTADVTPKFTIKWDRGNPITKNDGTAFPKPKEAWLNWTLKKILETYSKPDFTGDGAYIWYVTKDNYLVWRRRENYGTQQYFDYNTDEILDLKTKKDLKDVKNFLIVKGGRDPAGRGIQDKVVDYDSVNKNGRKFYFYTLTSNSADDVIARDTDGVESDDRYPATFPFTTVWQFNTQIDEPGQTQVVTTPDGNVTCTNRQVTTVTTKKQYNAIVREHVRNNIQLQGNEFLDAVKYGKFKADLKFRAGKKIWVLGDEVTCIIPQSYTGIKKLRITEIQYSTTTDTYSMEEDIGSVGSY